MEELLQAQLNAQRAGVSYAVVTIAEASGSVPRTSGKMLVYADGHSLGTIGGGPAERRAKADALAQLDAGKNAFLHYDFPTPGGASCAGRLSILIEVFQPKPLLVVFGGGHVGTSLLRLAAPTGFRTLLLDDRDYPMTLQVDEVARLITRAIRRQRRVSVIDWRWNIVVGLWRLMPNCVWVRLPIKVDSIASPAENRKHAAELRSNRP